MFGKVELAIFAAGVVLSFRTTATLSLDAEACGVTLWHWLGYGGAALGALAGLFGLHRLCLWLEARGWLYYRDKKPESSAASCWVGLQQIVEPGTRHVLQLKQEKRTVESEEAAGQRLFRLLQASLGAAEVHVEEVRLYLTAAKGAGLDWRGLYEQAVQAELSAHPDRAALLPLLDEVAPDE
jgi:hypothetical protein